MDLEDQESCLRGDGSSTGSGPDRAGKPVPLVTRDLGIPAQTLRTGVNKTRSIAARLRLSARLVMSWLSWHG